MRFLEQTGLAVAGIISVLAVGLSMVSPAAGQVPDRGDLVITGSASPNPGAAGGQVAYLVNIKNTSTVTATGVLVTIRIPQDFPAPEFVKCSASGGAPGQPCTESGGVVTTTFPTIKAHIKKAKVSVTVKMPGGSATYTVVATAHADNAIGGQEPRDGSASIASTVLSDSVPVMFQPSQRTASLSCGDDIKSSFFESGEDTIQLRNSMGCAHSKVAVTISASGKTFDFQGFKIVGAATDQIKGSVGILVSADNVTIVGGGTGSKNGIEYFDYCLMDDGTSDGLTVSNLRCFRARSAGIDLTSDKVTLNRLLVDLVAGGTNTTTEIPGGIGMHLSGSTTVKDSIVRRAASIGILADGAPDPDGTKHRVQIDGNYATSRVEASTGIGIQLEGGFHEVRNTYVEGDGDDGVSTTGVLINASGTLTDGLQVVDFGGNGFLVNGAQATIKRSTVEAVGSDSFVVAGAGAALSGNSAAKGQKGFVFSGPDAFVDTNEAENVLGTAFLVSGDRATMTGNSTKAGKAEGFVLSGNGGNYNTNKAEASNGAAFTISGNDGLFLNNVSKSSKKGEGFLVTGTNNSFSTNRADKNKGVEWVIAAGNVDLGSNRVNGKTFTFTKAGITIEKLGR
jgi:uncharacterized repeat protein (TIGR01451 family)